MGPTTPSYTPPKIVPGRDHPSFLGFLRAMVGNPISAAPEACYRQPVAVMPLKRTTLAYITGPDLVEEILVKRPADFPKSLVDDRILRPAFGNGLLTAEGDDWRWKRRLLARYFAPSALARHVPEMVAPFQALVEDWRQVSWEAERDVAAAMTAATFDVIRGVLFSNQQAEGLDGLANAIDDYLQPISWVVVLASLKAPAWMPHPGRGQIHRARDRMRAVLLEAVADRRRRPGTFTDVCQELMDAGDPETGRTLNDVDMVDMLLTVTAAGHETSAKALTWTLYCLAAQPALQDELAAEAERVVGDRAVEADDLARLPTFEAVIKETMRLFPTAPLMSRRTTQAERLGGHDFPPGTILFIPIYAIHRHQALWPGPDVFDHTRFLGDTSGWPRTAYMPFGAGPRICAGSMFAMMEMVAGLATLLRQVRFSPANDYTCELVHRITLRPKGGLPLKTSLRN